MGRMAPIALIILAGCAHTAQVKSTPTSTGKFACESTLNRNMFTREETKGYEAECDPTTGKVTLKVDQQNTSTDSQVAGAVAEGLGKGFAAGLTRGAQIPVPEIPTGGEQE